MEKVIYEAQGNVDSIKPTEVRGISVIEVSTEHGDTITIELPSDLLKFKEKERVRIIFSKSEDVEDVDGLFNCVVYKVERHRKGKEERAVIYGSIGGLQVRVHTKSLHRKVKVNDLVLIGVKMY